MSQITLGLGLGISLGADPWAGEWLRGGPEATDRFALTANVGGSRFSIVHGWDLEDHFDRSAGTQVDVNTLLSASAFASPYLDLLDSADGIALTQELSDEVLLRIGSIRDQLPRSRAGIVIWLLDVIGRASTTAHVELQLGRALETESLLGMEGSGALQMPPNSNTIFTRVASTLHLNDGLEVFGQASLGATDLARSGVSLLRSVSAQRSSSFGVGMARGCLFNYGGRLTVAVSQPLRIDAGTAVIDRAVGWTADGRIQRSRQVISLEPEGREVDIELGYLVPLGDRGSVALNWLSQLEPGHDRHAPVHMLAIKLGAAFLKVGGFPRT